MALYPAASWRPIAVNYSGMSGVPTDLAILHVMQGSLVGTDSWFHNPAARSSAHFGIGNSGQVIQWVNTDFTAWHACNANSRAIGIETEGYTGKPLTDKQVVAAGQLLAWLHRKYPDIDLWLNRRPSSGTGLSYHGLGGAGWCNHPSCPGQPRINQLPQILRVAKAAVRASQRRS